MLSLILLFPQPVKPWQGNTESSRALCTDSGGAEWGRPVPTNALSFPGAGARSLGVFFSQCTESRKVVIIFWLVGLMKPLKTWSYLSPLKADFQTLFGLRSLSMLEKSTYVTMAWTHTSGGLSFKSDLDIAVVLCSYRPEVKHNIPSHHSPLLPAIALVSEKEDTTMTLPVHTTAKKKIWSHCYLHFCKYIQSTAVTNSYLSSSWFPLEMCYMPKFICLQCLILGPNRH